MASNINADNGVVSGSAGLKTSADSTGVLALQTNGTTAVTVNASQNVGIGTTSPATKLDVSSTTAVATFTTTQTSGNALTINVDGNSGTPVGLRIAAGFGTIGSTAKLINVVDSAGGNLFNAQASGVIGVGSGIAFPATQSASTNANTLDDYEEGTWTVGFRDWVFDVNSSFTYTSRSATYTKIGRVVTCYFTATIATATAGNGQAFGLEGLPFDPNSSLPFIGTLATSGVDWPANTLTTAITYFSTTNAAIFTATGDNVSTIRLTSGGVSAGDVIQGSLVYYVA